MKTTFKISLAVLIMITTVFSSCKKYPDGPMLSLASKKSRLVNTWKMTEALVNGQSYTTSTTVTVFDIKKDDTYTNGTETGTWAFSSDKTSVTFTPNGGVIPAYTSKILKLKSNALWLQQTITVFTFSTTIETHYSSN
jgi:hypothetical protein